MASIFHHRSTSQMIATPLLSSRQDGATPGARDIAVKIGMMPSPVHRPCGLSKSGWAPALP
jgi:hypothetical protein